eukprot:s123_g13.t1
MAQPSDRWALKILTLPIFSDAFAQAILKTPYANLAIIAAMEVHSAAEFVIKVHEWSSSLSDEINDVLLPNSFMLEQYWKILKKSDSDPSHTPLLDRENAARWKWASKLEEIGKRAGQHSKLLNETSNSEGLSAVETARLRRDLAIQAEIVQKRATTLKEACPFPLPVVGSMEAFVTDRDEPEAARLFVWWWLFDDAVHVKPNELTMNDEGLFGVAWQTKVGWDLFQKEDWERDFWVRDLNTRDSFRNAPPNYNRSLQWIRNLAKYSLYGKFNGATHIIESSVKEIGKITAHSARVTMLDAAVHAQRSTEEIGLQANWKNPGPLVLKYTRNRTSIPARMVHQLVKDLAEQEHPFEAPDDAVLDEADQSALDEVEFFVKTNGSRSAQEFRYHCLQLGDDSALACNRLPLDECTSVGAFLPDPAILCKHCAKARPEVASRCFTVVKT